MFEKNSDEGVSPVVGVILMVAITVILSAIIATFVLDLGGTVSQNPQAGVTFDQSGSGTDGYSVAVQVVSMENADYVAASVSENSGTTAAAFSNADGTDSDGDGNNANDANSVGTTINIANLSSGDRVTVTATLEGKTQVTQTYTVDA